MGGAFSKKRKANVIIVGLDNSGKTTILNYLKPPKTKVVEITPTVGYLVEEFQRAKVTFTAFDMSGQGKYRSLWEYYYKDVQAIIFVIDSADRIRICVAKDELLNMLNHPDVKNTKIPILFLCNKMDLKNAMEPVDIVQAFDLDEVCSEKPFTFFPTNALTGDGLESALDWLVAHLP
eukprot:GCRY01001605.1.p1 GENE.GCRY01001605.1~~GCRY01001605.1.p1  ORF type:complete len:177 (+),score=19.76 GCRY01001605.1:244-774(+)